MLKLIRGPGSDLPWTDSGEAPSSQDKPRCHSRTAKEQEAATRDVSTARAATVFGIAALLALIAGVNIERSGESFFGNLGLSGVLFGATVLPAATSLPELSTGLTAGRSGDYKLAMVDIFGGNAFLPAPFLLVTLISGKAVLPHAQASDIYLTALCSPSSSLRRRPHPPDQPPIYAAPSSPSPEGRFTNAREPLGLRPNRRGSYD